MLWLGTGTIAPKDRKYRSFDKAREFVRGLGLKSTAEWRTYTKSDRIPADIPTHPDNTYKDNGWVCLGDWLGTGATASKNRQYRSFDEACEFVKKLGLQSNKNWREYTKSEKRPHDIPAKPERTYKDKGWAGYGMWLGTGVTAPQDRQYRPFDEAKKFVRELGLKSEHEWRAYTKSDKRPPDIPVSPHNTYKNKGWIGMGDWLGTGTIAPKDRKYRSFDKAREFVRGLGLQSTAEWAEFTKSDRFPADIPLAPGHVYKNKGWAGYRDWFGTGTTRSKNRK